jgi:hypothetical protein
MPSMRSTPPASGSTVQVGPMVARATVVPTTFDEKTREVDVVMGVGAEVVRVPWFSAPYVEELGMAEGEVRMDRLASGRAPFLESHRSYSLESVIGRVVSARLENGQLVGRVQFSARESVRWIVDEVRAGILSNLSIGYRVHKFEDRTTAQDKLKRLRAVDWEPYECSLVPIGADRAGQVRSALADCLPTQNTPDALVGRSAGTDLNDCLVEAPAAQTTNMPQPTTREAGAAEERATNPSVQPAAEAPATPAAAPAAAPVDPAAAARAAEQARTAEALRLSRVHRLGEAWVEQQLADPKRDIAAIQRAALDQLAARSGEEVHSNVQVGATRRDKVRGAVQRALEVRMGLAADHTPESREMGRFSVSRLAELVLDDAGLPTRRMSVSELADFSLKGRNAQGGSDETRGLLGTDDFANLLSNVQGKAMRKAYEANPQTWLKLARKNTAADFKPMRRIQLSGGTGLSRVNEHGEVKRGTMQDEAEVYNIETEGLIVGFSRKAFVNDDMGELVRVTGRMGARAADRRSDLAWALITGNVTMADGIALFHASHSNLATGGASALSETSIEAGYVSMSTKADRDGNRIVVRPSSLIVPVKLYVQALKLTTLINPTTSGAVNALVGLFDDVIKEPRLDVNSQTAWYMAGAPGQIDVLEYSELAGSSGPQTAMKNGFDVDGVEFRILDDFGVSVLETVSLYKAAGV